MKRPARPASLCPALAAVFAGLSAGALLGAGGGLLVPLGAIASALRIRRAPDQQHRPAPMTNQPVTVELLYFDGCPGHAQFLPRLHELLDETGVSANIEQRRVESLDAAVAERFLGSPTVRINGQDIEPQAADRTDYGMKCRLYRTTDGLQGTPPDQLVLDAIGRITRTEDRA